MFLKASNAWPYILYMGHAICLYSCSRSWPVVSATCRMMLCTILDLLYFSSAACKVQAAEMRDHVQPVAALKRNGQYTESEMAETPSSNAVCQQQWCKLKHRLQRLQSRGDCLDLLLMPNTFLSRIGSTTTIFCALVQYLYVLSCYSPLGQIDVTLLFVHTQYHDRFLSAHLQHGQRSCSLDLLISAQLR